MPFALRVFPADSAATAQWGFKSNKNNSKNNSKIPVLELI